MAFRIGSYEVLEPIGRGGAGTVFRVRSPAGEFALKLLLRATPEALARFDRERRLQATLGEGFVPIVDAGTSPRGAYLVMPLLAGGTLRDRLRQGRLPVGDAVLLGIAMARCLGRAHERGIVHRDVKPENILFASAGNAAPLVADLGLAKHFDLEAPGGSQSAALSGASGVLRGTVGYAPPEQITDARSAGPPANVFALGAILYECLTGRRAFTGEHVLEVLDRVQAGRFEPVRASRPETPRWLAAVVERALAMNPEDRFTDGVTLARALETGAGARSPWLLRGGLAAAALALVLSLVALCTRAAKPATSRPAETIDDLCVRAEAFAAAHQFARAVEVATRAIERDPRSARALSVRSAARTDLGDHAAAIDDATRALALDPRLATAFAYRAWARSAREENDQAILDATRAIELDPRLALAFTVRGHARAKRGDFDGALADAEAALKIAPSSATLCFDRGCARERLKDQDGALSDLTRACELDPRYAIAFSARGELKHKRGDAAGAIADASKALDLDPTLVRALNVRSASSMDLGDHDAALVDANRALELDPRCVPALLFRCGIEGRRGNLGGVLDDATRVLEIEPRNVEALAYRANTRANAGDVNGALADADLAVAIAPNASNAVIARALARSAKGDIDGAIADFERYIELTPGNPKHASIRATIDQLRAQKPGASK